MDLFVNGKWPSLRPKYFIRRLFGCFYELFIRCDLSQGLVVNLIVYHILTAHSGFKTVFAMIKVSRMFYFCQVSFCFGFKNLSVREIHGSVNEFSHDTNTDYLTRSLFSHRFSISGKTF